MTPMVSVFILEVGDLYEGTRPVRVFLNKLDAESALAAYPILGPHEVALITEVAVWPLTVPARTIAQKTLREIQRWDAEGKTSYHPSA